MSESSEEFAKSLQEMIESRRDEAEQLKRAYEEELRVRHGITAKLDEHGKIDADSRTVLELGAKRRGRIEKDINDQLEKILGKEQALQNRKQVLYEKELEKYDYFIDGHNNLTKILSKQNLDLDNEQKKVIERLRKDGVSEEKAKAKKAEVQKAQDEFGSNLAKGLGDLTKGLGSFAMGLANGNTNFTSLNPLIDIVANSLASLAKAIPFVGEAIAGATKAAAEGAKFVLELMDKNLKAFQELANAGALTAEGMEGVSRQFLESGMSLEGFKKAIRENAGDLAQWGKTVGGGADKFTKAVGMLTKGDGPLAEAGLELRKLGMTADDIGTASAGFLQQEIKLGRARNMDAEQLAKGTAKYANELDALQKITGLSKEDLIKQRNEMLSDSRFAASMDMLREENETGAEAMMSFASIIKDPTLKRGFMDLASGAVNTEAAKLAYVQMGTTVTDVIDTLKNSKPENFAKQFGVAQDILRDGAKDYSKNFREAAAIMPDPKKLGNWSVLNEIAKSQNVSMEESIEIQKKQKAASGGLTEDTVTAQQNMERMGQEVFKMGTLAMPLASRAVNAFTKSMVDLMKHINKILGKDPTDGGLSNSIEDSNALQKQQDVMDDNIIAQKELKDAILLLKKAQTDPNKTDKDKTELQKAVDIAKTKANKTQLAEEEANKQSQITAAKKMEKHLAMRNEFTALNAERRAKGQEAYVDIEQAKAGGHKFKAESKDAVPSVPAKSVPASAPSEAVPSVPAKSVPASAPSEAVPSVPAPVKPAAAQPSTASAPVDVAKIDAEIARFTKGNDMSLQANNDYVAKLQSKKAAAAAAPPTPGPGVNVASNSRGLPATQSADDVMKLIRFQGDSLGTKKHFDALDSDVKQKFIDMIAEYGKPVQINAAMRSEQEQQVLYDKWIANGKIGNPVAKPGKSNHNFGRALDLNSNQVSALSGNGLLNKYGFNTIPNDPPHIEMASSGGVFSGPESGYPVMLHGNKETVVTKPQFDEMANVVKKESVTTAINNLGSTTTSAPAETPSIILQELLVLMEDKFDEMISQLSTSNTISDKLLRNAMV